MSNGDAFLCSFGGVSADRIRFRPTPGTATEADALFVTDTEHGCELIRNTLVETVSGLSESYLTTLLTHAMMTVILSRKLGMLTGPSALYRMSSGNLRIPDIAFTKRSRLSQPLPDIAGWCPDLCAEVLSPGNTRAEMAMKRTEYFESGCRLVWEIDHRTRTAAVYTNPATALILDESGTLDGRDVLPGFTLPLRDLLAQLDELHSPTSP